MKVMLTGGTGFLGGHVMNALIGAGHEVRALVRSEAKLAAMLSAHGTDGSAVTGVLGDILEPATVAEALQGCDACIHAAAFTTLDPAEMPKALEINAPGTRIVLDAAVAQRCDPIIHVSSMSVVFPPSGERFSGYDDVHYSGAPYTDSKVDSDLHARGLQDAGHPVLITYPSGVMGPTDLALNVMDGMLAVLAGAPYMMTTDSGGYLIHDVRDLAAGIAGLVRPGLGGRRYFNGGHYMTWDGFAALLDDVTGLERQIAHTAPEVLEQNLDKEAVDIMLGCRPGDDDAFLADSGLGGWRPLGDTLRDTLAWLIAHGHLDAQWAPKVTAAS